MRSIVTITDQKEIRRVFSAVFGEHYHTFWQKLGAWVLIAALSIRLPISAALQPYENLSPFWRYFALLGSAGCALCVLVALADALHMRISITRNEISRTSPFRWFSWSMPIAAISSLRVRYYRGGLIVTITGPDGLKRSFSAPASLVWNLGPATGLCS